jgi:cytochrome c peroxidase
MELIIMTNPKLVNRYTIIILLCLILGACNSSTTNQQQTNPQTTANTIVVPVLTELDQQVLNIAKQLQLTGDPSNGRDYPPAQDSRVQLGKQLFFQANLLSTTPLSCAQCHDPSQGGTIRRALASGIMAPAIPETIPDYFFHRGRTLLPVRNAPSTFNSTLWDKTLFHDGRVQALNPTAQHNGSKGGITTPLVKVGEPDLQAGRNLPQAATQLAVMQRSKITQSFDLTQPLPSMCVINIDEHSTSQEQRFSPAPNAWLGRFRQGFNMPDGVAVALVTHERTVEALTAYIRSQVFINTPWKHYLEGNPDAISETAKQGALLFFRSAEQGGFGCARCHQGDSFTDEDLHRTLMPPLTLKRPFRSQPEEADYGRWFITHKDEDKFLFRTPSLLNVTETGPWGHNGAYSTLSAVVRHMLDPVTEASHYDTSGLSVEGLAADHLAEGLNQMLLYGVDIPSQKYSHKDLQALIAFLHTLTDPCVKDLACLKPWLPDNSTSVKSTPSSN